MSCLGSIIRKDLVPVFNPKPVYQCGILTTLNGAKNRGPLTRNSQHVARCLSLIIWDYLRISDENLANKTEPPSAKRPHN